MSLRTYLSENNKVSAIIAVVVLAAAGALVLRNMQPAQPYGVTKWMFDMTTQKLVAAPIETVAPADLGGGTFAYAGMSTSGSAVDAMVYSCGDPTAITEGMGPAELASVKATLAFVMRHTDRSAESLRNPSEQASGGSPSRLVALPDGAQWVPENAGAGIRIQSETVRPCPDGSSPVRTRP